MFIVEIENLNDDLKILKIIRNIFNTPPHPPTEKLRPSGLSVKLYGKPQKCQMLINCI